jgi:hypothetical protein
VINTLQFSFRELNVPQQILSLVELSSSVLAFSWLEGGHMTNIDQSDSLYLVNISLKPKKKRKNPENGYT